MDNMTHSTDVHFSTSPSRYAQIHTIITVFSADIYPSIECESDLLLGLSLPPQFVPLLLIPRIQRCKTCASRPLYFNNKLHSMSNTLWIWLFWSIWHLVDLQEKKKRLNSATILQNKGTAHQNIRVHVHIWLYVCIHVSMHACMYVCMYGMVCRFVCVYVCTYVNTYVYAYVYVFDVIMCRRNLPR